MGASVSRGVCNLPMLLLFLALVLRVPLRDGQADVMLLLSPY